MYKLKHNYKIATCVVNIYHKNNKSKEYIYFFLKVHIVDFYFVVNFNCELSSWTLATSWTKHNVVLGEIARR